MNTEFIWNNLLFSFIEFKYKIKNYSYLQWIQWYKNEIKNNLKNWIRKKSIFYHFFLSIFNCDNFIPFHFILYIINYHNVLCSSLCLSSTSYSIIITIQHPELITFTLFNSLTFYHRMYYNDLPVIELVETLVSIGSISTQKTLQRENAKLNSLSLRIFPIKNYKILL